MRYFLQMAVISIGTAILDSLLSLTEDDFESFVFRLKDRSEEPRIRGCKADRKTRVGVTEVMVSTFTKLGALKVTVEILRGMRCHEEADYLESRTKVLRDKRVTFCKTSNGNLEIIPSQEARDVSARNVKPPGNKAEEVKAKAKKMVKPEGGGPSEKSLFLSRLTIQFGKYHGQTFKWLLENDADYVALILDLHRREREDGSQSQHPLMKNKDSLAEYVAFVNYEGLALIGFGKFKDVTLKDLYDSTDEEKVSYVNFLRGKVHSCIAHSKMEVAIHYILRRDQERRPAVIYKQTTSGTQPSGPKKLTKRRSGGASRTVSLKKRTECNW